MVHDGKESGPYDAVDAYTFSPDGSHFAYRAKKDNKWQLVVNGFAGEAFDGVYLNSPPAINFSPDGVMTYFVLKGDDVFRISHTPHGFNGFGK